EGHLAVRADLGEEGKEMIGGAESAQREDQIDPAVMQDEALEIDGRSRQLRIHDQPAHGCGKAGAEYGRQLLVIGGSRPEISDVDIFQPAITVVDCPEE